jgi:hypothetical protein
MFPHHLCQSLRAGWLPAPGCTGTSNVVDSSWKKIDRCRFDPGRLHSLTQRERVPRYGEEVGNATRREGEESGIATRREREEVGKKKNATRREGEESGIATQREREEVGTHTHQGVPRVSLDGRLRP